MIRQVILFLTLLLVGILAGTAFGVCVVFNPDGLSAQAYVEHQQLAIRGVHYLIPTLASLAILATFTSASLHKTNRAQFFTLLIAGVLLVIAGLMTLYGTLPINSEVREWKLNAIPANWTDYRDRWWSYHLDRTVACLIAFVLVCWMATRPKK